MRGSGMKLSVHTDADYAAIISNDRRSVYGAAVMLGDTAALFVALKEALSFRTVLVFLQPELTELSICFQRQ